MENGIVFENEAFCIIKEPEPIESVCDFNAKQKNRGKELVLTNLSGEEIKGKYKRFGDFSEGMLRASTEIIGHLDLAYFSDHAEYAGVWGFINSEGVEIVPAQYIYAMDFDGGLAPVCKGKWTRDKKWDTEHKTGALWTEYERWGFIDTQGNEVIPCVFNDVKRFWNLGSGSSLWSPNYFGTHYGDWKDGEWGIIDRTGKWVIEPMFDDLGYEISEEGCFEFYDTPLLSGIGDATIGIYSIPEGRVIFEPQFTDVSLLDNGLFAVSTFDAELKREVTHIVDKSGKALFPSEYSFIRELETDEEGVFYKVTIRESDRPNRSGIVDEKGNVIVPCNYGMPIGISRISIKKRVFVFEEDGKCGVKDFDGKTLIPATYNNIYGVGSDFLSVTKEEQGKFFQGLLLLDGTCVLPCSFRSIDRHEDRIVASDEKGSYSFRVV